MKDIVRILQDIATEKELEYHYGKKAALNLLDGDLDNTKIFLLHEFTNRKSEYNTSGTRIAAYIYEGKFFLVKHSDYDQQYFREKGQEETSKYTMNIEPLLTVFSEIGNTMACAGLDVTQWDNIDVTDALDANMDGILCTYRIKVPAEFVFTSGGGDEPPIDTLQITNVTTAYLLTGTAFNLQITTNEPAQSFSASFLPSYLTINNVTGVITGMLPETPGQVSFQIGASGVTGTDSKTYVIHLVNYDTSVLFPPQNISVIDYNPNNLNGSFLVEYELLYYTGGYERMEMFIDGDLYRTFINGQPIDLDPGVSSDLMQRVPPFQYNVPMLFKMRLKDYNGNYSDFSEEITVTIPQP